MTESEEMNEGVHLAFDLEDETFAIDIAHVREVLEPRNFTRIPHFPEFIRGAVNVRGSVDIVADMRGIMGMPEIDLTEDSRVVMIESTLGGETVALGALVDSVRSVMNIPPDRIQAPPESGLRWRSDLIKGIGGKDGRFIIILDVEKIHSFLEESLNNN